MAAEGGGWAVGRCGLLPHLSGVDPRSGGSGGERLVVPRRRREPERPHRVAPEVAPCTSAVAAAKGGVEVGPGRRPRAKARAEGGSPRTAAGAYEERARVQVYRDTQRLARTEPADAGAPATPARKGFRSTSVRMARKVLRG